MEETKEQPEMQFYQLVISLHAGTMQQLGKVTSPMTGKIERNIEAAKSSIDLLEMLERKMKGNLNEGEGKLLETTLFELRMNYVDELKKDKDSATDTKEEASSKDEEAPNINPGEESSSK